MFRDFQNMFCFYLLLSFCLDSTRWCFHKKTMQFLLKTINRIICNKFNFKENTFRHRIRSKEILLKREWAQHQVRTSRHHSRISTKILHNRTFCLTVKVDKSKIVSRIFNNKMKTNSSQIKVKSKAKV